MNGAGKAAKYQYNGLGHRVGKLEGTLSRGKLEGLDPRNGIKAETEIGNWNQIRYTIDLTREYHNLLVKEEGERSQTYFWDGNVTSYEENGRQSYYLQDELGSPIRIEDETGAVRESYGYGAFGEDLYGNQGEMQPFGYTGYQRDKVAGTYYAQAREYQADAGRFSSQDIIGGFSENPETLNRYSYCWNNSLLYIDNDGEFPTIAIGAIVGGLVGGAGSIITDIVSGEKIDWKRAGKNAFKGAVTGALVGSGVGIGTVIASGTISSGISTISAVVRGESVQDVLKSTYDGFVDGAMWGGIMAGGSKIASHGMHKLAEKGVGRAGVKQIGKVKILSPNRLKNPNGGGTLIKFGKNIRIDVELGELLHCHFIGKNGLKYLEKILHSERLLHYAEHFPLGIVLTGILSGVDQSPSQMLEQWIESLEDEECI